MLPGSYVGELTELGHAVVGGNLLVRMDTGAVARVTDAFLRADLRAGTAGNAVGDGVHRLLGVCLLVLSLPLWPIALGASLLADPRCPLRRVRPRRRGSRTAASDAPEELTALERATSVPGLHALPRLLSVAREAVRLVGVTPLSPAEADSHTEEWERVRDEAPGGLVGPAQLALPLGASREECRVAEAYYARTRTTRGDLGWLMRGARALLTARAWRPRTVSGCEPWLAAGAVGR
ncbi:MAG TPA: hypothetical protein VGB87_22520 [Vicinamibacteria bacterium]